MAVEDNVEIVRRYWDSPVEAIPSLIAEDIDYRAMEGAPDDVGVMRGREAHARYLGDWAETFEDFRVELEEVESIDDERVLVVGRVSGQVRGAEAELRMAALYTVRDGLIVRGREYPTKEEALAAARD